MLKLQPDPVDHINGKKDLLYGILKRKKLWVYRECPEIWKKNVKNNESQPEKVYSYKIKNVYGARNLDILSPYFQLLFFLSRRKIRKYSVNDEYTLFNLLWGGKLPDI